MPRLLEWLEETKPDVACLQEIKTMDEGFPAEKFEEIGYGAIWHGQKSFNGVAILTRDQQPEETKRGLDGEPEDEHSRYLEANVKGKNGETVRVASIYLPNGNPHPGPKFDFKLRWMKRLRDRAAEIWAEEVPAVLAGDYNVIPRDNDVFSVKASQAVFAAFLNTSPSTVQKWEQGQKKPNGPSLKLLNLVDTHGLEALA